MGRLGSHEVYCLAQGDIQHDHLMSVQIDLLDSLAIFLMPDMQVIYLILLLGHETESFLNAVIFRAQQSLLQFDPAPLLAGALPVGLHEIVQDRFYKGKLKKVAICDDEVPEVN